MRNESLSHVAQLSLAFMRFSGTLGDTQIINFTCFVLPTGTANKTALAVPSQQTYAVRVCTFASANLPRKMLASYWQCASSRNKMVSKNSGSGENGIGLLLDYRVDVKYKFVPIVCSYRMSGCKFGSLTIKNEDLKKDKKAHLHRLRVYPVKFETCS